MLHKYYAGLDLGQKNDYSALAILQQSLRIERPKASELLESVVQIKVPTYQLRYLRRFDLGTPYTEVVSRVQKIIMHPQVNTEIVLIADATGLGQPILEAIRHESINTIGVWIHGGAKVTQEGQDFRVPKRDLVSALSVLVESRRLSIAAGLEHAQLLEAEMLSFKAKILPSGHETYEAMTESVHDDLILAVSLAAWFATRKEHRTRLYSYEYAEFSEEPASGLIFGDTEVTRHQGQGGQGKKGVSSDPLMWEQ